MWYYYSMTRKCIYTGLDAEAKQKLISREILGEDEKHNWANYAPVCKAYEKLKEDRAPTDLEIEAHEIFYQIEILRLKLRNLEVKQDQIQSELRENLPKNSLKKVVSKAKNKQIEQAIHENQVVTEAEKTIKKVLDNKKSLWR